MRVAKFIRPMFFVLACAVAFMSGAKAQVPGLRGVEHIGLTVPNLKQAVDFFVNVLGCESFFTNKVGPFKGTWMKDNVDLHPATTAVTQRVRCGNGANFELLEFNAPDQRREQPKNSDYGASHFALYVDDLPAAVKYLKSRNVRVLGKIKTNNIKGHPTQGNSWVYVQAPWGTYFEFVSAPKGLGYESTTDKRLWSPRS